ncbi:MAG TPA: beta-ketoacyl-[acyl-carrier-protein] synthase family protein [Noviherbaspirillum sp.]|nr:beta-ketoacyl-[acyl-carrier-protein] synthase family protein [Noviherbaspirillum sp.]
MRRIAITGIGVVSPLGNSAGEIIENLVRGRPRIRRLEGRDFQRLANPLGAPSEFDPGPVADAPKLRMMDRSTQFALAATRAALAQAGLDIAAAADRAGVFIGTGSGGAESADSAYRSFYADRSDRVLPFSVLLAMHNAAASWIGLEYGLTGPNLTYSTACSSSAVAIGEAALRIRSGATDIMIAGGTEAPLCLASMRAWEAMRTIAAADPDDPSASCKPFSKNRSGMVLGEGAAIVILEEWESALARNAPVLAEVSGYGLATDASHLTAPSVQGQARAMELALADAGMEPEAVDYINAHGTGTVANDVVETAAIRQVFGAHASRLRVSSTKSMHGHLLGAAGALEFAISVLAMNAAIVPPTANLAVPDPECDLDYVPNQARVGSPIRTAMSNSFAFGGTNAVLVASCLCE